MPTSTLSKLARILVLTLPPLAVSPSSAWAIQAHAGPEGLYVHQGAHIFLAFSMLGFALNIQRSRLTRQKAWRFFASGSVLFILWNIWAFIGHLSPFALPPSSFIMEAGHRAPSLLVASWREVLYYFLKMDHLVGLPALLFFYFGLKLLLAEFSGPQEEEERQR